MIYVTGDTHGDFRRLYYFTQRFDTTKDDILIILGDAGVNYFGDLRDDTKKQYIANLDITLFCIHGNHEQRPYNFPYYKEQEWHGGNVYIEDAYPNILFAKDGEIYDLNGLKTIAIGGAYSVDRQYRILHNYGWWPDEQPSDEIKQYVEEQLELNDWQIDIVLSHTTPLKYEPTEVFLSGIDQSKVDKSTEQWLDNIENKLDYKKWYCGHYHTEKKVDRIQIMFNNYDEFGGDIKCQA